MAAGFLTVVSAIPWGTLVEGVPQLVSAANKLTETIRQSRRSNPVAPTALAVTPHAEQAARIDALERRIGQLEEELASAGQLLEGLAAANAALIRQTQRLMYSMAVSAAALFLSLVAVAICIWK